MAVNLKLTRAIKDRVVQNFQLNASVLLINFVDGNNRGMQQPTTSRGCQNPADFGGSAKVLFECDDNSTLDLTIVEPGNSVIIRDKNNQAEYFG